MHEAQKDFLVAKTAAMDSFSRGTVEYQVRTKKLQVQRTGKKEALGPSGGIAAFLK